MDGTKAVMLFFILLAISQLVSEVHNLRDSINAAVKECRR